MTLCLALVVGFLLLSATADTSQEAVETTLNSTANNCTKDHEEHVEPAYAILMPWFVQAVGIVVYYMATRYKYLGAVPYTCVMFIIGILMGVGTALSDHRDRKDQLTQSIIMWRNINKEVLFSVFLPGLLFKDAIEINFHLFQAALLQLLILAFPMVLAGTCLTALVAKFLFPYEWSWFFSLTLGSILAATDPVAVSALMNEVGAPPRLRLHITGESMLNDGSAVVFFTVFSMLFLYEQGLGQSVSVGQGFALFFQMSLGGFCFGMLFALGLVFILYKLERRFEREETVLQVTATVTVAYLCFYTAEVTCQTSGVIAVVTCGILTKAFGGSLINDWQVMDSFWSLLEHLLNTVLFSLGGIQFGWIVANRADWWEAKDWGYLFMLYVLVNIVRFALLFAFFPLLSRIGLKTNWQESLFTSWAGLRGAVGIALALGLDSEVNEATSDDDILILTYKLFGMVGGVAFFSLVINGTLCGPLLSKLGLVDSTESRQKIIDCAQQAVRRRFLDDFIHLMTDPRYYFIDFAVIMYHCPMLRDLSGPELTQAVEDNKKQVHPDLYKHPNLETVVPYVPDATALQQTILRAKRALFMSMTTGSNLDLEGIDEEDNDQEQEESPALLQDMRIMFIELLRAAYTAQIKDGELDPREYEGFLSYSLLQSLEFAHDEANAGKPLDDWNLSQTVTNDRVDKAEDVFVKTYSRLCVTKGKKEERIHTLKDIPPLHYQQLRLVVLRAFSFVDAHQEAEYRLRDEFGSATGEVAKAFATVIAESQAQVDKAKDVLRSKTKKQLKDVISHYLCIVLLNKSARYIKLLVDSGVLLPREARHYLEEIDHEIRRIRYCPLEIHPGTLQSVIEEEDEELREPKRRRKRVKQQSIL